jgi:anti-anti-sigma factor
MRMKIKTSRRGDYCILSVKERVTADTEIDDMIAAVKKCVEEGAVNVAVCFTHDSYLSTRSISALVQCNTLVDRRGGTLAIVEPNQEILDTLDTTGLVNLIRVLASQEDIPG